MAAPQEPAAAGGGRLRAGHADRAQVIDTLKDAFTQGRLTSDELDERTGQALAARTYAELDVVTADIPGAPRLDGSPALARRWPLARAAVKSGGLLVIAAAVAHSGDIIDNSDPNGLGPGPHHGWTRLLLLLTLTVAVTALVILIRGVAASVEQRRPRRQLPSQPGQGGQAPEVQRPGQVGRDPALPRDRPDQVRADLRSDGSRPGRPHSSGRGDRVPRGIRPVQDAG